MSTTIDEMCQTQLPLETEAANKYHIGYNFAEYVAKSLTSMKQIELLLKLN